MKVWKILRDCRRAAHTLTDTASGIAHLYNIVTTGERTALDGQRINRVTRHPLGGGRRVVAGAWDNWTVLPLNDTR